MLQPCLHSECLEAGCDEAGRGCLAGPVYAAAVLLPKDFHAKGLNDSKQLTEKQRYSLRETIEQEAIAWAVGIVSSDEIDKINILNASILAMQRAVLGLCVQPEFLLIDGNRFRYAHQLPLHKLGLSPEEEGALKGLSRMPYSCEVKGDSRFLNIAAASVLAKTYRDDCMLELHAQYPEYHWDANKGYPTKEHREAIRAFGVTKHHRTSFKLLEDQLSLNFE